MEITDTRKMWETELVIVSALGIDTNFLAEYILYKVKRN